ncbi:hypothetical protein ACVW0Q_002573 [Thermostichus sp. MS-CIW-21]|jgi:hypothetical protein
MRRWLTELFCPSADRLRLRDPITIRLISSSSATSQMTKGTFPSRYSLLTLLMPIYCRPSSVCLGRF